MGTITRTLANNVTTALGKAGGMTFITSATPSGSSSSIEMQSCFSATYQNYIVIFTALDINTNNSDMVFRMMSGSSEHTGGDYYWGIGTSNRAGTAVNTLL